MCSLNVSHVLAMTQTHMGLHFDQVTREYTVHIAVFCNAYRRGGANVLRIDKIRDMTSALRKEKGKGCVA